jgi:hypothetical protein
MVLGMATHTVTRQLVYEIQDFLRAIEDEGQQE